MATSASNKRPPKSILKPPSRKLAADRAAEEEAREIATQHAHIIHSRRALEDTITDNVVALSKHPLDRGPSHSAVNPSARDVEAFKSRVRLFQPSDYDDLIEERNANGLCGYTLCPAPRMRLTGGGEWKIVGGNIVPKKELEKWCSPACAKRAMYIKVQLNETAAWERAGIESIQIDLYTEPERTLANADDPAARLAKELEGLEVDARRKAARNAKELALERGDDEKKKDKRSVDVTIQEKIVTEAAQEPSWTKVDDGHLILEGYKTKFDGQSTGSTGDTEMQ